MTTDFSPSADPTSTSTDETEPGTPLVELNAPPTPAALTRLADRLRELSVSEAAAAAIARAVSDPAAIRRRLGSTPSGSSPGIITLRVPGGRLLAFNAEVNALAVAAWPVNPRQASRLRYPVETAPGTSEATKYRPLTEIVSSPLNDELFLRVEDHQHAIWAYDRLIEYLKDLNDLAPRIAREGVISPVILAPATISAGAKDEVTVLMAVDGSSRVTAAQRLLGVTGRDILYRFPHDRRALNDATARVRQIYGRSEAEVSEDEVAQARVLNIPAFVVVAFEADEHSDVDFASAVRSYIGLTHVDPPKPWDDAGTYDTYGAAVLDELRDARKLTEAQHEYLAGLIPVRDLVSRGFSGHLDTRAAHLVHLATRPTQGVYDITGRAIRRVSRKSRARQELRMGVFCELILRSMRVSTLGGSSVSGVRAALQRTYVLTELTEPWDVTTEPLEELLEAAVEELHHGKPGRAARELAVRGAYWLIGYGVLGRDDRGSQRGVRDTRRPSTILSVLMRSEHGLRILHRAAVDGRASEIPRMVDDTGTILRDASGGQHARMSTDWLRRVFPPETEDASPEPVTEDETPTAALERARRTFVKAVDACSVAMKQLAGVESTNSRPLIEEEGIAPAEVEALRMKLRHIEDQLIVYRSIHQQTYPPVEEIS
ncbi:hypothetical protein [Conexibacter sp. CPCC 206217]|uniref:hypothetical protein n=1 Tax=Conexibacter sp. CPCC 206217 TaxID=3064574 RepID=UPI002717C83B|nr:hypothetical protein [Conexibacter sp. CPCC 206217]MDO8213898.1 hypothetical protein [Conexibacter sp. CPCC 206217]